MKDTHSNLLLIATVNWSPKLCANAQEIYLDQIDRNTSALEVRGRFLKTISLIKLIRKETQCITLMQSNSV